MSRIGPLQSIVNALLAWILSFKNLARHLNSRHGARPTGVEGQVNDHLGQRAADCAEISCRQLNIHRAIVFIQALDLARARDRHDPRFLRQQPG